MRAALPPRAPHRVTPRAPRPPAAAPPAGAGGRVPQPDPAQLKEMEAAMQDPAVQAQVAQMTAAMQSDAVQARFVALRADPDLAPMFADIQANGMAALMKYMNDDAWLAKIGSKAGDVGAMLAAGAGAGAPPSAAAAPAAAAGPAAAAAPAGPVVNDLFDAAKHGDLEAVEDFVAVGKDVAAADAGGRTPLHYAVAYGHAAVVDELIAAGAPLAATDGEGNTPLHYAAGYGRGALVERLVAAGAPGAAENAKGQTPVELVTGEPRNPLHGDAGIVAVLENAALAGAE